MRLPRLRKQADPPVFTLPHAAQTKGRPNATGPYGWVFFNGETFAVHDLNLGNGNFQWTFTLPTRVEGTVGGPFELYDLAGNLVYRGILTDQGVKTSAATWVITIEYGCVDKMSVLYKDQYMAVTPEEIDAAQKSLVRIEKELSAS